MSLFKQEEKVSIPKDEYIKQQIELENMKYRLVMAQEYIVSHKVINRETVGTMLGIPANMLKGEN
jgi:hypothetical protein